MTGSGSTGEPTVLVIDMANVLGSVPDGWWRDRAGATGRLLNGLVPLSGRTVTGPYGEPIRLNRILVVLEGKANSAKDPEHRSRSALEVVRASGSGDDEIAAVASGLVAADHRVLVVTADRGLRARLPSASATTGPGWLNALLGRA